ncbi:MAG: nickel insertion protein, partial [Desulfoprunum sp.]|uniref:nickel insertion protein n=1 Tax=Desulfoprunum sp. TaxID=2020866 RepID=UPI003C71CF8C
MPPTATIAYLDCFAGISGDMVLAALIDAGLPPAVLRRGVDRMGLGPVALDIQTTRQQGLRATRVEVSGGGEQPLRTLPDLLAILERSGLAEEITAPAG